MWFLSKGHDYISVQVTSDNTVRHIPRLKDTLDFKTFKIEIKSQLSVFHFISFEYLQNELDKELLYKILIGSSIFSYFKVFFFEKYYFFTFFLDLIFLLIWNKKKYYVEKNLFRFIKILIDFFFFLCYS